MKIDIDFQHSQETQFTLVELDAFTLGERASRIKVESTRWQPSEEVGTSELRISNVKPQDWQTYMCVISNDVGSVTSSISLTGDGKFFYYSTCSFTAITNL